MKKSRKIIIGVVTGVIVAAIAGTLLGIFIPRLLNKSKIEDLVAEQVKPLEGNGNFLKYETDQPITTSPYNNKLESIENFSKKALNLNDGFDSILNGLVSNFAIEFWKNYKDSIAYTERFEEWNKDIDKEWNDTVDNYKKQYGDTWEFYFQLKVLDPVGGNEDDWKRQKLVEKANTSLDEYLFSNFYINALNENGDDVITNFPSPLTENLQRYLTSPNFINGTQGFGTRNKIVFQPSVNETKLNPNALSIAKFQEFVFTEWVKNELPLITSMTLWKHVDPTTVNNQGYTFFNSEKAEEIYKGNYNFPGQQNLSKISPREDGSTGEGGDSGGETPPDSTGQVGITTSYKWQAFPVKQNLSDAPNGELSANATDKYLSFASSFNNNAWQNNFIINGSGGAINIDVKYTDDSATLYFIKLGGGSGSVFNTSYTQYAAGSNYKFNEVLGQTADANVPMASNATSPLVVTPIVADKSGSEIMANFMSTTAPASGYYVELPKQITEIINDSTNQETGYIFKGLYNGVKYVTDTVNIPNSPFILTRNESGVHIIGIDRAEALNKGYTAKGYEGLINEISNTLLWRYILTKAGMNGESYLNNGFTSFDVQTEIKTYYDNNRDELLFKYILSNESTIADTSIPVFFNQQFTTIDPKILFSNNPFKTYINTWINYNQYAANISHNDTVSSKIMDIQKTANSLTYKTFGNTVIQNGIAAMQPYTRNVTANQAANRTNQGYVDNVYGMYDSLKLPYAKPTNVNDYNLTNYTLDINQEGYKQSELLKMKQAISQEVDLLYSQLQSQIGFKTLTYSSAKYNQYLLIGSKTPTSDRYYSDNINLINDAVGKYISNGSDSIKNVLDIQRLLASTNYDPTKANKPTTRVTNKTDVLDVNNFALTGSYQDPTHMVASAPAIPSTSTDINRDYVNYHLQKSFDIVNKIPNVTSNLYQYQQGLNYDQLLTLSRDSWVKPLLQDEYSSNVLDFIKQVLGIKYAFDFNQETGNYEFTKFKEYLVQQTQNNKKAAFVWVKTDRNDLIKDYETQTLDNRFAYKPFQLVSNNDVNGYIYQNAPNLNSYKDSTTGLFNSNTTFDETTSRYVMAPVTSNGAGYTGFQGMVFENSSVSDLPTEAKTALFNGDLYVYPEQASATPVNKGSLYNVGDFEKLVQLVQDSIYTWDTLIKTCTWLNNTFGINTQIVNEQPDLDSAKKKVIAIMRENYGMDKLISPSLFELNKGAILSTGSSIFGKDSQYFGDKNTKGAKLSQVVFTQFNYYDVVKLFDTDNNNILDDKDKGINWTYASTNGFLNTSAEAFFISAIQWFNTQSSYVTTATKNAQDLQGKFETFDRRLNNLFGEDLVSNYKKEND